MGLFDRATLELQRGDHFSTETGRVLFPVRLWPQISTSIGFICFYWSMHLLFLPVFCIFSDICHQTAPTLFLSSSEAEIIEEHRPTFESIFAHELYLLGSVLETLLL